MAADLAHRPEILYAASLEREQAAWAAFARSDYVLAIYLAGLAVECILQAIAFKDHPAHEARHDLPQCLARCRRSLQSAIDAVPTWASWSFLVRVWRNEIRYYSSAALIGYLRRFDDVRRISGGPDAIMKTMARRALDAASLIHGKGVVAWTRYWKK